MQASFKQEAADIFDLTGKVAVVTGAGNGLGAMICEAMAEAGANVVCGDIDEEGNSKTAEHVRQLGREAIAKRCDVTNDRDVVELFDAALEKFGKVDIAFANAGISDPAPSLLHEYTTDNWRKVMSINLDGVFYTCRAALKSMIEAREGKLIIIASMWGLAGASSIFPIPAYNAAKGGVVNLTRELALEYAPYNIQVNAICPGFFRSKIGGDAYEDPEFVKMLEAFVPMGRVAETNEIKGPALFLASSASSYTTGLMLVSDGGCLAK